MRALLVTLLALFFVACGNETKEELTPENEEGKDQASSTENYSPYTGDYQADPLPEDYDKPLWGDTHLHTSYSTDAGMAGNTLDPEQAYRFALGEEVTASNGMRVKLIRPLDFLVVSDHSENLGLAPMIAESNERLLANPWGKEVHDMVKAGNGIDAFQKWLGEALTKNYDPIDDPEMSRSIWEREIAFADQFNDPGKFTAMIGFEWTSSGTEELPSNLHRVVIFKDDAEKARTVLPYSTYDSYDPEDLWKYMASYEENTGGSILAIAHNGNLSNGLMFPAEVRLNGEPIDKNYVETRARYEPLYEVTQIKGDGEAHPFMSTDDEFADYGNWDKADIAGYRAKEDWMLPQEYARSALQIGLQLEDQLGTNPYKFGMIGSTDAHTSLATTREENFFGKASPAEPAPDRFEEVLIQSLSGDESLSSYLFETIGAGLAAVWSRENTREAIFDAMARRETYATTGTRMIVRFYGGYDYTQEDLDAVDMVDRGYEKGVPMGGDLQTSSKPPVFMVKASKDVDGANLDRIQIVKGWVDSNGDRMERIYDLAVSDGREIGADGRCRTEVGNTVDVANASFDNSIGDIELSAIWTDPDFDPELDAFYYIRVLEIPTPTWLAYDAKRFSVEMPSEFDMFGQERAYTSPIWYNAQ